MTRPHAPAVLAAVLALAAPTAAQQPAANTLPTQRVIGPNGPGLQQQVNTSPYQSVSVAAASRGVNPFAAQGGFGFPATYLPGTRVAARPGGGPVVIAPLLGAVPNNPGAFNPGFPAPLAVLVPQVPGPLNPVAFNPVLVSRPGVVSAYYVPPITVRQAGMFRYADPNDRVNPASGTVHDPVKGTATLADGTTYQRVPGVGPDAPDSFGTGLYYSAETGTGFNPSSGFIVRPGEFRYIPWVW
ncbi:hypothetical protein J0H58_08770 [bacterium]|nr:hypothetical protein [bacterium]